MIKEIELTCYRLNKLGIYSNEHEAYLSPKKLMRELKKWAFDSNKPLVETKTFDSNSQTLEAYCLDFYEHDGDYILGLWNKVSTSVRGVGSVRKNATPVTVTVSHAKIDKDSIPGFPTYFYISPKKNLIAPIKLDLKQNGILQFRNYIKGYLKFYSSHIVDRVDGKTKIRGLCKTSSIGLDVDNRFPDKNAHVLVTFAIDIKKTNKQYFIDNAQKITKVVKDLSKEDVVIDEQQTCIERIVRAFEDLPMTKEKPSRITVPVNLNQDYVEKLFKSYEDNGASDEYNIGFKLIGDNKIRWMSGTANVVKLKGEINFHEVDKPNLESLMKLIKKAGVTLSDENRDQQKDVA